MADENKNSQVQQIAAEWEKFVTAQVAHFESFLGEVGKVHAKALAFSEQLGSEWRKLALEAARKTAQAITPRV